MQRPGGNLCGDLNLTGAIEHVRIETTRQQHLSGKPLSYGHGPFQQVAEIAEVFTSGGTRAAWNERDTGPMQGLFL